MEMYINTCRKATQKSYIKLWIPKRSLIPLFSVLTSLYARIYVCDDSMEARLLHSGCGNHLNIIRGICIYTILYSKMSEGRCVVLCNMVTIPKRSHPYIHIARLLLLKFMVIRKHNFFWSIFCEFSFSIFPWYC